MKEEITSQKKLFKVQKKNVTAKDKRPLLLFCFTDFEQVSAGFAGLQVSFIFSFFD